MPLVVEPMGRLALYINSSWNMPGPLGTRSMTEFKQVIWETPHFTLRSLTAHARYRRGERIAEVDVRVLFQDDDGVKLFLQYLVRNDMPMHSAEKRPAMMTGQIDVEDTVEKYRWLNETMVIGHGWTNIKERVQSYDMFVMRSRGDEAGRPDDHPFAPQYGAIRPL